MASTTTPSTPSSFPPDTLPGSRLMGFVCCQCSDATLTNRLGRCHNTHGCGHLACRRCTLFDRAGRMWSKNLAIDLHWMCQCGKAQALKDALVRPGSRLPACSCGDPTFVAMYNLYGRRIDDLRLPSVQLPLGLSNAEDVGRLRADLSCTSYGSSMRLEQDEMKPETGDADDVVVVVAGEEESCRFLNLQWHKASLLWSGPSVPADVDAAIEIATGAKVSSF